MFGFRSFVPSGTHRSLIDAENALAEQSARHADGWGIGWFADDEAMVVKSAAAAHSCAHFRRASERLRSQTFIVHVRRATVGLVDPLNTHPFRFGRWLFAHNGTIFGYAEHLQAWMEARTHPDLSALIVGDTDSEGLFYYLLSRLHQRGIDRTGRSPSPAAEVAWLVREALLELDAAAITAGLDRPILNVLLTDGRAFIAHRAGMPLWLSTQKRACTDEANCNEPTKVCLLRRRPTGMPINHLLVASEKIGNENYWEDLIDGTTVFLDQHFRIGFLQPESEWTAPTLPTWAQTAEVIP